MLLECEDDSFSEAPSSAEQEHVGSRGAEETKTKTFLTETDPRGGGG